MTINFNANQQHAEPIVEIDTAPRASAQEAREAAEAIVRKEIIETRLSGDERQWKRWVRNNDSFYQYRVRLTAADLNGTTAGVQAADAYITEKRNAQPWREHSANAVVSPTGIVMTKRQARLLGWEG